MIRTGCRARVAPAMILAALGTLVTLLAGCSLIPGKGSSGGAAATSTADRGVTWQDDFSGSATTVLDASHWNVLSGGGGWGDRQLQTFTAAAGNLARSGDGQLRIQAVKGPGNTFTSAEVTTRGKVSLDQGTVRVRMKAPVGPGLSTVFSLYPVDGPATPTAANGAVDVAVIAADPNKVYTGLRGPKAAGGTPWRVGTFFAVADAVDTGYHTYAVQKTTGQLGFGIDGRVTAIVKAADLPAGDRWVFDQPFYIALGVAVGGSTVGPPTARTTFPAVLLVDSVSVSKTVLS